MQIIAETERQQAALMVARRIGATVRLNVRLVMRIIAETERQSRFRLMRLVHLIIQIAHLSALLGNVTPVMFNPAMPVFRLIRIVMLVLPDIRLLLVTLTKLLRLQHLRFALAVRLPVLVISAEIKLVKSLVLIKQLLVVVIRYKYGQELKDIIVYAISVLTIIPVNL